MDPIEVTKAEMVLGGNVKKLMPPMNEIPEEFTQMKNKWNKLFSDWFFSGLPPKTAFVSKDNIDANKALRHIRAIMASMEPAHEHKEAAVSFLLSEWFKEILVPKKA